MIPVNWENVRDVIIAVIIVHGVLVIGGAIVAAAIIWMA
jgi:hypothetical protein